MRENHIHLHKTHRSSIETIVYMSVPVLVFLVTLLVSLEIFK